MRARIAIRDLRRRRMFYERFASPELASRAAASPRNSSARARARGGSSLIESLRKGTRAGGLVNRLIFAVA